MSNIEKSVAIEKALIIEHKDELDTACKKERIVATKCPRCGRIHPVVSYFWHLDIRAEPSVRINILCPKQSDLNKVFKAEEALREIGIHFDTGYGGSRDWEFDWSLSGNHYLFRAFPPKCTRYVLMNRKGDYKKNKIKRKILAWFANQCLYALSRIT